jgi:hypothetical protein
MKNLTIVMTIFSIEIEKIMILMNDQCNELKNITINGSDSY